MTRNVHAKVTSINWGNYIAEAELNLPGLIFMTINDVDVEADLESVIADKLSNDYGIRPKSFKYKVIM